MHNTTSELEKEIQKLLDSIEDPARKRRLQGIQWKCDVIRMKSNNHLQACIEISKVMWESFLEMNEKLKEVRK